MVFVIVLVFLVEKFGFSLVLHYLCSMMNEARTVEMLEEHGTNLTEILQIADDSGLSLVDIMQIISYLNSKTEESGQDEAASHVMRRQVNEQFVGDYYYNSLLDWLRENNVNLNDLRIGF